MKKNGFTLVELLGVIVLLALIFTLVFPSVQNIINESRTSTYENQIRTILDATYNWSLKNMNLLPDEGKVTYITLSELKSYGFVDTNIVNPITDEPFPDNLVISIADVGNSYKNNSNLSIKNGRYLYTVELELTNSSVNSTNRPIIQLEGLLQNSKGDYVTVVDLNGEIENAIYHATSSDGVDLTDKVIVTTINDGVAVEKIDTSKVGIYQIKYTVVDNRGNSATVIRNVIIGDTEPPVLVLPPSKTLSLTEVNYDLMEGVICTDNSTICNVSTEGSIKFGVADKYIIEYTAKDPAGNTTTGRRVITVE